MDNLAATLLLAFRLLMALALYGFLGWGLWTLWRDLKQQSELLGRQHVVPIQVDWEDGGEHEALRFTSPEVVIGRHPGCEWMVAHETVSSRHARLVYHHDQWWLEDLGSRNGTYLNEEVVSSSVVLASADAVRCGQLSFTVHFEEPVKGGGDE